MRRTLSILGRGLSFGPQIDSDLQVFNPATTSLEGQERPGQEPPNCEFFPDQNCGHFDCVEICSQSKMDSEVIISLLWLYLLIVASLSGETQNIFFLLLFKILQLLCKNRGFSHLAIFQFKITILNIIQSHLDRPKEIFLEVVCPLWLNGCKVSYTSMGNKTHFKRMPLEMAPSAPFPPLILFYVSPVAVLYFNYPVFKTIFFSSMNKNTRNGLLTPCLLRCAVTAAHKQLCLPAVTPLRSFWRRWLGP